MRHGLEFGDHTGGWNSSPQSSRSDHYVRIETCNNFNTEVESCKRFDELVESTKCFTIYREVRGFSLQPRLNQQGSESLRIDRILSPKKSLIDAGWIHGPIGVECKRSGKYLGPVLSQAMDYARVAWMLPHGFCCVLDWIFVWPLERVGGEIASIMDQHRIGHCFSGGYTKLAFSASSRSGIVIETSGEIRVNELSCGRKIGSR